MRKKIINKIEYPTWSLEVNYSKLLADNIARYFTTSFSIERRERNSFVRSFVRETRQRDDRRDEEEDSGKIRNIRLVELCPDRAGTHLLLVNSSPGKEGRRVCWERGLEKKRGIRSPFFVQHLNNSLRHAVYANLLRR